MNKKVVILLLVVVLAIGGVALLLMRQAGQSNSQTPPNTQPTEQDIANADKEAPKPSEQNKTPAGSPSKISITNLSQDENTLYVRTVVEGATSGNCLLELRKGGRTPILRTAPITLATSYYTCEGFNIPKSEISTKGEWTVSLKTDTEGAAESVETITVK